MGKSYDGITPELSHWIERQHMFFVATAPLASDGLINCSPKGMDTFRILGPRDVAYLDLTGSGIETVAHARENGRIVFMFCAFEGAPKIVRLHGTGDVCLLGSPEYRFDQLCVPCVHRQPCDRPSPSHADQHFVRFRRATGTGMAAIETRSVAGRNRKGRMGSLSTARQRTLEASMDCQVSRPGCRDLLTPTESGDARHPTGRGTPHSLAPETDLCGQCLVSTMNVIQCVTRRAGTQNAGIQYAAPMYGSASYIVASVMAEEGPGCPTR